MIKVKHCIFLLLLIIVPVNIYAYELAYRIYIPNDKNTFEKILTDFGYKKIEKEKILTKKR